LKEKSSPSGTKKAVPFHASMGQPIANLQPAGGLKYLIFAML
jgi:hypothetical protein